MPIKQQIIGSENTGQDVTVHQRWVPSQAFEGGCITLDHWFTKWYINECKVGEYISSGSRVYRVDAVPMSSMHWVYTREVGTYTINLNEIENVCEGHKLFISTDCTYSSEDIVSNFNESHVLFLQNRGDVHKYLHSIFYMGKQCPEYAENIYQWYETFLFENHLKDIVNDKT